MKKGELEGIKNKILETGFPLEAEITSELLEEGWDVKNSSYFVDQDENKGREIDIKASKSKFSFTDVKILKGVALDVEVVLNLIIECKKTHEKWAFYKSHQTKYLPDFLNCVDFFLGLDHTSKMFGNPPTKIGDILKKGYISTPNPLKCDIISNISQEVKLENVGRNSGNPPKIFDASIKVIKALYWEMFLRERKKSIPTTDENPPSNPKLQLHIFLPVIILEGDIVEAKMDGKSLNVKEIKNRLQYLMHYESGGYQGKQYLIEIVRKEGLYAFLHKADEFLQNLTDFVSYSKKEIRMATCQSCGFTGKRNCTHCGGRGNFPPVIQSVSYGKATLSESSGKLYVNIPSINTPNTGTAGTVKVFVKVLNEQTKQLLGEKTLEAEVKGKSASKFTDINIQLNNVKELKEFLEREPQIGDLDVQIEYKAFGEGKQCETCVGRGYQTCNECTIPN